MGKFTHETDITGYNILSNEDLDALHESTLQLLEDYGLQMHGKEALDILAGAGCEVDYENDRVKFPRNLVNDAIEKCPAEFTLCGRDPAKDTVVGGKKVAYKNFGTGVFIFDPYTGELRESTKEDLGNVARFIDAIPEIDVFSIAVTAGDVNQKVRSLHEAEVVFNNLTKNFAHDLEGVKNTQRFIDMAAAIQGGYDKLRERPIVAMGACPNSPLEINENETSIIILSARHGLPIDILSMGLFGATTPATIAGTLVCTNAEILGGIVLAQIVNPGNKILYGSSTTIMDMKTAQSPVGAPEHAMCSAAVGQLGHYYGIPTNVGGTQADSKCFDVQLGHEKTMTNMLPALTGSNVIYGMGMMEMGMTMSYEQLLTDAEIVRMTRRILQGIPVNPDTMALDVIKAVGPANNYLAQKHTRKYMRQELSTTQYIDRTQRETWEKKGGMTMTEATKAKAIDILENYEVTPLPDDVKKRIHDIVVEGEEEAEELARFQAKKK